MCGVSLLSCLKLETFSVLVDETSVLLEEFSSSFCTGATLAKEKAKLYFGLWEKTVITLLGRSGDMEQR